MKSSGNIRVYGFHIITPLHLDKVDLPPKTRSTQGFLRHPSLPLYHFIKHDHEWGLIRWGGPPVRILMQTPAS